MTRSRASIQRTITLTTLVAVAVALLAGGTLVYRTVKERMASDGQGALETVMRFGASRLAVESRRVARRSGGHLDQRAVITEGYEWLVLSRDGEPIELARTESFPLMVPPAAGEWAEPLQQGDVRHGIVQASDGAKYRIATLITRPAAGQPPDRRLEGSRPPGPRNGPQSRSPGRGPGGGRESRRDRPPGGPGGGPAQLRPDDTFQFYIASPLADEDRVLQNLLRSLLFASALALSAAALMVRWTVRRGLRPVREISDQIGLVTEARLQDPLEIHEVPRELDTIVSSFEGTRARLADAFVREKRFTADAAHELRTPLAGLRASLEVALRRERSVDEYRRTAEECLEVSTGMEDMISSLLQLARGAEPTEEKEPVQVTTALANAFESVERSMEAHRLTLQLTREPDPTVSTSRMLLERILGNIARNAAQHAAPGSVVAASVTKVSGGALVRVSNQASALPSDTAERAFEPLWRADPSRGQAAGNSGLGLALVKQCAEALGGTATIETGDKRFEIRVFLPD